jgi:hypothetical protein
MWACVVLTALALVAVAIGITGSWTLIFALPCVLMMGAMVWMMLRMAGGSHDR